MALFHLVVLAIYLVSTLDFYRPAEGYWMASAVKKAVESAAPLKRTIDLSIFGSASASVSHPIIYDFANRELGRWLRGPLIRMLSTEPVMYPGCNDTRAHGHTCFQPSTDGSEGEEGEGARARRNGDQLANRASTIPPMVAPSFLAPNVVSGHVRFLQVRSSKMTCQMYGVKQPTLSSELHAPDSLIELQISQTSQASDVLLQRDHPFKSASCSDTTYDTASYGPNWASATGSYGAGFEWWSNARARSSAVRGDESFGGISYGPEGYILDVGSVEELEPKLGGLIDDGWLDEYTRAVVIQANLVSHNIGWICKVGIVFEFSRTGLGHTTIHADPIPFKVTQSPGIFLLYLVVVFICVLVQLRRFAVVWSAACISTMLGLQYLSRSPWHTILMGFLILVELSFRLRAMALYHDIGDSLLLNPTSNEDYSDAVGTFAAGRNLSGCITFWLSLCLARAVVLVSDVGFLLFSESGHFVVLCLLTIVYFVVASIGLGFVGFMLFGTDNQAYMNPMEAWVVAWRSVANAYEAGNLENYSVIIWFIFTITNVALYYLLPSILTGIMVQTFSDVTRQSRREHQALKELRGLGVVRHRKTAVEILVDTRQSVRYFCYDIFRMYEFAVTAQCSALYDVCWRLAHAFDSPAQADIRLQARKQQVQKRAERLAAFEELMTRGCMYYEESFDQNIAHTLDEWGGSKAHNRRMRVGKVWHEASGKASRMHRKVHLPTNWMISGIDNLKRLLPGHSACLPCHTSPKRPLPTTLPPGPKSVSFVLGEPEGGQQCTRCSRARSPRRGVARDLGSERDQVLAALERQVSHKRGM